MDYGFKIGVDLALSAMVIHGKNKKRIGAEAAFIRMRNAVLLRGQRRTKTSRTD